MRLFGSGWKKKDPVQGTLLSFPKSGRTWLRVMLDEVGIPMKYTHAGSDHSKAVDLIDLRFDVEALGPAPIVFLCRDPRDTVVSGYFQLTRRLDKSKNADVSLAAFVRDPRHGIEKIIRFNLGWLAALADHPRAAALTYELLKFDTAEEMRRVVSFLGRSSCGDLDAVAGKFEFSNMRQMEARGEFARTYGNALRAADKNDADSYKVRRGVIGGYVDDLSAEDVDYCNEKLDQIGYDQVMAEGVARLRQVASEHTEEGDHAASDSTPIKAA